MDFSASASKAGQTIGTGMAAGINKAAGGVIAAAKISLSKPSTRPNQN
jgi:hypothetical protein